MSATLEQVTSQALSLPTEARAFLAEKLLESLDYEEDFFVPDALRAEVLKRCRELDEGTVQGIPAEEVLDELRRELT